MDYFSHGGYGNRRADGSKVPELVVRGARYRPEICSENESYPVHV